MAYNYNNFQQVNPTIFSQQQRLNQMEQMYQAQNPVQFQPPSSGLNGRIVDNINNVNASEVSLNGEPCVFIKGDLSEVYIKRWNQNGLIDTTTYTLLKDAPPEIDEVSELKAELNSLKERFAKLEESISKSTKASSSKGGAK